MIIIITTIIIKIIIIIDVDVTESFVWYNKWSKRRTGVCLYFGRLAFRAFLRPSIYLFAKTMPDKLLSDKTASRFYPGI